MAGNPGENEIAGAVNDRIDAVWPIIAKRVRVDPAPTAECSSPPSIISNSPEDVTIVEIGNAIAAFDRHRVAQFRQPVRRLSGRRYQCA